MKHFSVGIAMRRNKNKSHLYIVITIEGGENKAKTNCRRTNGIEDG